MRITSKNWYGRIFTNAVRKQDTQGPTVTLLSATAQRQEPGKNVAPQYSPPHRGVTGITSTHSP